MEEVQAKIEQAREDQQGIRSTVDELQRRNRAMFRKIYLHPKQA